MGKAALLLVLGFSIAGARLYATSDSTDVKAAQEQGEYQADIIAREIARSAYNMAAATVNRSGSDINGALLQIGAYTTECESGVGSCYRAEGEMQGGRYVIETFRSGGNGVEIYAAGYFEYSDVDPETGEMGRLEKAHKINDTETVDVLQVDPKGVGGKLKIQFIDSQAGFCSAIFIRRIIPGLPELAQPPVQMVYPSGKNRNGERNMGFEIDLAPGTQMNFAIGIEDTQVSNWVCDGIARNGGALPTFLRPGTWEDHVPECPSGGPNWAPLIAQMNAYTFNASHFDAVHWALDPAELLNGETVDAPYAMVEVDPNNPQRWRIGFEDLYNRGWNLSPGHASYGRPRSSLAATKEFGYDQNNDGVGDGWSPDRKRTVVTPTASGTGYQVSEMAGADGFHDLVDNGNWPDFSDQVIIVEVVPNSVASSGSGCSGSTATPDPGSGTASGPNPGNGNGNNSNGHSNNGHGNNADGVDSSNPGQGHGGPNGETDLSCDGTGECVDDENGNGNGGNGKGKKKG